MLFSFGKITLPAHRGSGAQFRDVTMLYHTNRRTGPMDDAQIHAQAPSVFAERAHDSRSARYTYIPTAAALAGLRAEGFEVWAAMQSRSRNADRRAHTKHLLRLRHCSAPSFKLPGDVVPEIILLNSHDGSSSYQLFAGMFRLVCTNGLIVGQNISEAVRVPHKGDIGQQVIEGAYRVLDQTREVTHAIEQMQGQSLHAGQQQAFARAALSLRYGSADRSPISTDQVLAVRRDEDAADTVWTTFNRVQEALVNGGLRARSLQGRRQTTRAINGIDQNVSLNRALWTLAAELLRLTQAGANTVPDEPVN